MDILGKSLVMLAFALVSISAILLLRRRMGQRLPDKIL